MGGSYTKRQNDYESSTMLRIPSWSEEWTAGPAQVITSDPSLAWDNPKTPEVTYRKRCAKNDVAYKKALNIMRTCGPKPPNRAQACEDAQDKLEKMGYFDDNEWYDCDPNEAEADYMNFK